jgi:hypothetical protein
MLIGGFGFATRVAATVVGFLNSSLTPSSDFGVLGMVDGLITIFWGHKFARLNSRLETWWSKMKGKELLIRVPGHPNNITHQLDWLPSLACCLHGY